MYEYKMSKRGPSQKPLLYSINKTGCWINESHATTKAGYGKIQYNKKSYLIHRLIYELENNIILRPEDVIMHSCDNPKCFNPSHLILGTQQMNITDRQNKNRNAKNEQHGRAKLTNNEVIEIYNKQGTQTDIAKEYGISQRLVSLIKRKEIHKDLFKKERKING